LTENLNIEKTSLPIFHPKKQANLLYEWTIIWQIWAIHPLVLKAMKLPETAWVVSVNVNMDQIIHLLFSAKEHVYTYETLQDQILSRDLCFVVDSKQDFWGVLDAVKKIPEIKTVEVFDVYQWTNLPEGKKSVAFRIKIVGDPAKAGAGWTMTTEQINEVMNKAIKTGEKAGAILRS
jgi:phenylalanyl-tRNA synthetase beta chain